MRNTIVVDDLTIHRIVEQDASPWPAFEFFADLAPERLDENRGWLEPAALFPGTTDLAFSFHSWVVRTPHHVVLVDSCVGNDKPRPTRPAWHLRTGTRYLDALAAAGLTVDDVDFVLCTHLHADHVGWNTRLQDGRWVPTFPNARYLMSAIEYGYWVARHEATPIPALADSVLPIVAANRAEFVGSAHALDDHVRLLPAPGHTIDHFAVALGRGADRAVMTGDLVHSPLQLRYPELSARVDHDRALAAVTRRRMFERCCATGALMCTAHFPAPSAGRVEAWGDGFRFLPAGGRSGRAYAPDD